MNTSLQLCEEGKLFVVRSSQVVINPSIADIEKYVLKHEAMDEVYDAKTRMDGMEVPTADTIHYTLLLNRVNRAKP